MAAYKYNNSVRDEKEHITVSRATTGPREDRMHSTVTVVNNWYHRGAWGAQSVECLTSAQVMISQSVSLSPASGSVLTAQSLEPASESVSHSLSVPPPIMLCLPPSLIISLSLSQKIK